MTKRIIAVLFVALLVFALCGCTSKTPKTPSEFVKIMEDAGFDVEFGDAEDAGLDYIITDYIEADDGDIYFGFCVVDKESDCKLMYSTLKDTMEEELSTSSLSSSVSMGNYDYYSVTDDDDFYIMARIENTILYCETDVECKDQAIKYTEKLGYK